MLVVGISLDSKLLEIFLQIFNYKQIISKVYYTKRENRIVVFISKYDTTVLA